MGALRTDWKLQVVYWGLGILSILKFLKFFVLEVRDALGPLFSLII